MCTAAGRTVLQLSRAGVVICSAGEDMLALDEAEKQRIRCASPHKELDADISDVGLVRDRLQRLVHRVVVQKAVYRES